MIKYQDRVMMGKDIWEPSEYRVYFRVFETGDKYFDYYRKRYAFCEDVRPRPAFASTGVATCRYVCRNPTTGQITIRSTSTSRGACCSGDGLSCPAGTVFDGPISWNGIFIEAC